MGRLIAVLAVWCALVAGCGAGGRPPEAGSTGLGGTAAPEPAPAASPTAAPAPAPPPGTATPEPGPGSPVAAGPPQQAVAITRAGTLVVLDVATGQSVRTLAAYDSPEGLDAEAAATGAFLDSVAVDAEGERVYFSLCCEPAPGRLLVVPAAGGEPEQIALGYEPALSPADGSLTVVELQWLTVLEPDGGLLHTFEAGDAVAAVRNPAWSPDGRTIAFEVVDEPGAAPRVHLLEAGADSMGEARPLPGQEGVSDPWTAPSFDREGRLVVAEQALDRDGAPAATARQLTVDPATGEVVATRDLPAGVVGQDHDASGAYLLTVLDDGTARWHGPDGEGSFGQGILAAAW